MCTGATLLNLEGGSTSKDWPRTHRLSLQKHWGKDARSFLWDIRSLHRPRDGRSSEGQRDNLRQHHRERGLSISWQKAIQCSFLSPQEISHIQPLIQTKPSRQIISTWESSTGLTLLKSGSSWSHVLQDSTFPCVAATEPVALAQGNCDSTHHQGYKSWLSVTLLPRNSLLNEFSSFQQPEDPSERVVSHVFWALCWSSPRNVKQLQKKPQLYSCLPAANSEMTPLGFLGAFCFVLQSRNLPAEFAAWQWCWHLRVHICRKTLWKLLGWEVLKPKCHTSRSSPP